MCLSLCVVLKDQIIFEFAFKFKCASKLTWYLISRFDLEKVWMLNICFDFIYLFSTAQNWERRFCDKCPNKFPMFVEKISYCTCQWMTVAAFSHLPSRNRRLNKEKLTTGSSSWEVSLNLFFQFWSIEKTKILKIKTNSQ